MPHGNGCTFIRTKTRPVSCRRFKPHITLSLSLPPLSSQTAAAAAMGKKDLLASAPWRGEAEDNSDKFKDAKMKVTNQPGGTATMYVPGKKNSTSHDPSESLTEIDQELKYSFKRNYQFLQRVFTIDTLVKPLPPAMSNNVSRNLSFFTSIFTQFFDERGIANAQKALGLGEETKARNVR